MINISLHAKIVNNKILVASYNQIHFCILKELINFVSFLYVHFSLLTIINLIVDS